MNMSPRIILMLSMFSSHFKILELRNKGKCHNEWFRIQENGMKEKLSTQGEYICILFLCKWNSQFILRVSDKCFFVLICRTSNKVYFLELILAPPKQVSKLVILASPHYSPNLSLLTTELSVTVKVSSSIHLTQIWPHSVMFWGFDSRVSLLLHLKN